jgi:hypothetical protein
MTVESRAVSARPASPTDGCLYILPTNATGTDWSGRPAGTVMRYLDGGWSAFAVSEGTLAWLRDEDQAAVFDGGQWVLLSERISILNNLQRLGIGTTADANNPLSVRLNKALFTARPQGDGGDGSLRYTLNKENAAAVLSLLFQSGWAGRAELGLIGSDDLTLKVSSDGSTWQTAMEVAGTTGRVSFAKGAVRTQTDVFTANGTYTVPAWAQRLEIGLIGGGGGGGGGACGDATSARSGGGGGGAGALVEATIDVRDLGPVLTLSIGAGGTGGQGVSGPNPGLAGATGGSSSVLLNGTAVLTAGGGSPGSPITGLGGVGGSGSYGPGGGGGAMSLSGTAPAGGNGLGAGPGAGGGGGGLETTSTPRGGGAGGFGYVDGGLGRRSAGGNGGGAPGGAGSVGSSKTWIRGSGAGGGGGASSVTASGGAGANGGLAGGGGGGGGAARTGFTSGKGGDGGRGEVWITAIG